MDPDATLEALERELNTFHEHEEIDTENVVQIAEYAGDLNGWLLGGGFLPKAWQPPPFDENDPRQVNGEDIRIYHAVVYADGSESEELYSDWSFAYDIATSARDDGLATPAKVVTRYFRLLAEREREDD